MRTLLQGRHFVVTVDDDARILTRARTALRFESLGELVATYDELVAALDRLDRAQFAQLVDSRQSPARNDPQFEATVSRYHPLLYRGFRASAVLVQTASGRLQVRRMLEATRTDALVFADEGEALAYLRDGRVPLRMSEPPPKR